MMRSLLPYPAPKDEPASAARLDRIEVLTDYLATLRIKPKHFSMERSGSGQPYDDQPCGSSGCAIGWGTAIPEFKAAGLTLSWKRSQYWPSDLYAVPQFTVATFERPITYYDSEAICIFFGISFEWACWLFGPIHRTLPQEVRVLRRFIENVHKVRATEIDQRLTALTQVPTPIKAHHELLQA